MSITWILVANASAADLYANYGTKKRASETQGI